MNYGRAKNNMSENRKHFLCLKNVLNDNMWVFSLFNIEKKDTLGKREIRNTKHGNLLKYER